MRYDLTTREWALSIHDNQVFNDVSELIQKLSTTGDELSSVVFALVLRLSGVIHGIMKFRIYIRDSEYLWSELFRERGDLRRPFH